MKDTPRYKNPALPVQERVNDLLARMTLHEKVMQLNQRPIGEDSNPNNASTWTEFDPLLGSILSFFGGIDARNAYQRVAVEQTRLGIPIIWGFDVIYGYKHIFPIPLAQASAFSPKLVQDIVANSAVEARNETGVDMVFAPMCEVCRDPRWGRVMESYGEDPWLVSRLTEASVRGVAQASPNMSACLKHFCGYSASMGGRDYHATEIPDLAMRETYLPPFEAGVKAGAKVIMSSFNTLNGIPAVRHRGLLNDILRGEWHFPGFVVADCLAVAQLQDQGFTAEAEKQATAALSAGNDMDMVSLVYLALEKAVQEGRVQEALLDTAVARILTVKFELGLFEHPYIEEPLPFPAPDLAKLALDSALKTAVLLENRHETLPVPPGLRKIALVGPAADDCSVYIGGWAVVAKATRDYTTTLRDEISAYFPGADIAYSRGCGFLAEDGDDEAIATAVQTAEQSEVIFAALGERGNMSGEYRSRANLGLPGRQLKLLEALRKTGKPLVVLLFTGRPLCLQEIADNCDALLLLWENGYRGAAAAWELVTGLAVPSGKLPMSFPRVVGQIPCHYNQRPSCRSLKANYQAEYIDLEEGPLYPFGYGLSYTTFDYSGLQIAKTVAGFRAEVTVTNTGKRPGRETVIWYLGDPEAEIVQPQWKVIGAGQVALAPGEKQAVTLDILPDRVLAYPDATGQRHLEPGRFILNASKRCQAEFWL